MQYSYLQPCWRIHRCSQRGIITIQQPRVARNSTIPDCTHPAHHQLNVALPDEVAGTLRVSVQNALGIPVASFDVQSVGSALQLPVAQLPAGLYCVKFGINGQAYSALFVTD